MHKRRTSSDLAANGENIRAVSPRVDPPDAEVSSWGRNAAERPDRRLYSALRPSFTRPTRRRLAIPASPPSKRHPYDQWAPDARALDLVGDKWTLLIVRDLVAGPRRFVELQRVLPGISTEQLRSRLNRMVADGLLARQRYREVPPRVDYELTERARDLLPVIGALARWGYKWAWTAPRDGEAIDIGAVLRCAPGFAVPVGVDGAVEITVVRGDGELKRYVLEPGAEHLVVSERSESDARARIRGDEAAWVDSLGPEASGAGLDIGGDLRLAHALLAGLSAEAARMAAVA
ncbi:MAG: helix-turn-helix transcriptional regulator [Actinomycetota bacterium]|nr:helix-turn-helix transcriptional regulator [Actinomycetota bacterium]